MPTQPIAEITDENLLGSDGSEPRGEDSIFKGPEDAVLHNHASIMSAPDRALDPNQPTASNFSVGLAMPPSAYMGNNDAYPDNDAYHHAYHQDHKSCAPLLHGIPESCRAFSASSICTQHATAMNRSLVQCQLRRARIEP
jgi:hypothetical protein